MERNLTILVADDNDDDLELLKMALRKNNILNPVEFCRDGEETLDYLKGVGPFADRLRFPFPSVLFLDLKMPKVTGFEVLQWLRDHPQCHVIPVMVMSASQMTDDVIKAYRLGANAYIVKPSSFEELVRVVKLAYEFWAVCIKPPLPQKC